MNKKVLTGIGFGLLSALGFTLMSAFGKIAQDYVSYNMVVFFRFIFAFLILLPFVMADKTCKLKTSRPIMHLMRDIAGFGALVCLIYASKYISVVDTILLNITYPLFIPIIMAIFYRVKLTGMLMSMIGVGFIGVLMVLQPSGQELLHPAALVALASGVLTAIAIILTKELSRTDSNKTIGFYLFLFATLVSGIFAIFHWQMPPASAWLILLAVGAAGVVYQQALAVAVKATSSNFVAPIMYASVVFGSLFDWLVWKQIPNGLTIAGFALILAGVLFTLHVSKKQPEIEAEQDDKLDKVAYARVESVKDQGEK